MHNFRYTIICNGGGGYNGNGKDPKIAGITMRWEFVVVMVTQSILPAWGVDKSMESGAKGCEGIFPLYTNTQSEQH